MEKHISNDTEELENQLHKQYAENENSRGKLLITFIIGIIALFGFYGYVFAKTGKQEYCIIGFTEFSLMAFITSGMLCFLAILTLYLGYSLRRDQIIVCNIRNKRYTNNENYKCVFDNIYKAEGKCRRCFLPDFHNLFYWLFVFSQIFVLITTILKYYILEKTNIYPICYETYYCIFLGIVIFLQIICIFITFCKRFNYFKKYKKIIKKNEGVYKKKCKCRGQG